MIQDCPTKTQNCTQVREGKGKVLWKFYWEQILCISHTHRDAFCSIKLIGQSVATEVNPFLIELIVVFLSGRKLNLHTLCIR